MSKFQREDHVAIQKAVAPIILSPDFRATDWESRAIEDVAIAAIRALATRPQPTANVDAEQVWQEAWDAYHGEPWPRSISESEQAIAVIRTAMEAYGDARADAARREVLDRIAALEAKLAEKDAQLAEAREALGLIIENESADTGYGNSSAKIARAALGDWKPEAGDLGGDHVR